MTETLDPNYDHVELSPSDLDAYTALCHIIGSCLVQFATIEESLAALYCVAAEIPKIETAFKTHDEIREFQYRLNATNAVVRFWIKNISDDNAQKSLSKEWNALNRIIKEDSQERNRIAHSTLSANDNDDGSTTWFVVPYFQFYSHLSEYNKQSDKLKIPDGVKKFDMASMDAKLKRFAKTSKRIDRFIGGLTVHGAQLPKSS